MVMIKRTDSSIKSQDGLEKIIEYIKLDYLSVKKELPDKPVSIETMVQTKTKNSELMISIHPKIVKDIFNILELFDGSFFDKISEKDYELYEEFKDQLYDYVKQIYGANKV